MENKASLPFVFLSFFFFKSISGVDDCRPASCSPAGPLVRFPFRILSRQHSRCGFPGFELSCNDQNQTLIELSSSQSYIVNEISYDSQVIRIDPEFCRPKRISNFDLFGTPFQFGSLSSLSYTFFNCSLQSFGYMYPAVPFPCLSTINYSVIAVRSELFPPVDMPANCQEIATITVPIRWYSDRREELSLTWMHPDCRSCEMEDGTCGFRSDDRDTTCSGSSSRGIPKSIKYGLSIGISIPAFICLIGLLCYTRSRMRAHNPSRTQGIDLSSIIVSPQPPSLMGLDEPTIESYPKTILGESCRLPKDNETCPICLSDYEPKESLRTIPECNHYFHAGCIDEWLRLNATCPVCRNSPESSSLVTSCSLTSPNSSDSS